jgi:translation initiation factor IF-2
MSDSNDTDDKTQGRRPIKLKTGGGSGTVRQSFSHGRTKAVVVEKKRKRIVAPKTAAQKAKEAEEKAKAKEEKVEVKQAEPTAPAPVSDTDRQGAVLQTLTKEEQEKRLIALEEAKLRAVEEAANAEVIAKRRAEEDARLRVERDEQKKKEAELEARQTQEQEQKQRDEEEAARKLEEEEARRAKADLTDAGARVAKAKAEEEEKEKAKRRGKGDADRPTRSKGGDQRRRSGKLTITRALSDDDVDRGPSIAARRRRLQKQKMKAKGGGAEAPQHVTREVVIPEAITVQELANRMAVRVVDVIKFLMAEGSMAKHNDLLDADMAELIVAEFGHVVKRVSEADVEEGMIGDDDDDTALEPRSPVVTVMGHVDHGKTSLLDAMRQSDVVGGEAGGITQHIGAYQVELDGGHKITFLDTPGHAAFTQMRARGAKATDIVILVVAADDGVMPQTIEAINHAKAAEVPIIVAINKCDKPDANPDRVRQELLQHEIVVESMGGDIQDLEVSALKKQNLDGLQEAIILQSEILELKANPDREAQGIVVEARLDKGRGAVATVLVQRGTLNVGDILVAGAEWGKVRALINDRGEQIEHAGPSVPVEVLGLNGTPEAGDSVSAIESEARAREVTEYRQRKRKDARVAGVGGRGSLEQMLAQIKDGEAKDVPVLIKGDVQGSVEAIIGALDQLSTDEVVARIIHGAVGGISESDVILAHTSGAPILAFNVRANKQAREAAERDGVEIRYYSVIYDLIDEVKGAMSGMLEPTRKENFVGYAEILEVFNISKVGKIAGCRVTDGIVKRGNKVRLLRDNVVIHEGTLSTLKRFKDEVKEVVSGQECGMAFENYHDLQVGDQIECFEVEIIERTL